MDQVLRFVFRMGKVTLSSISSVAHNLEFFLYGRSDVFETKHWIVTAMLVRDNTSLMDV